MLTPDTVRDPALALKATPPRAIKGFQGRMRLSFDRVEAMGGAAVALLAPAGFGKTAQLVQWRREALGRGSLAFWFTADERDEPHRFVQGLTYAAREISGKRGFDSSFMQWLNACLDPMSALTGWLAEVALLAVDVLLIIDDVERLPALTRTESLAYLLGNAPSNLHIALGARPTGALDVLGTLSKSRVTKFNASDLRFTLDETFAFVSHALGSRATPDLSIRLHELVEGWPLGVQMAVSALHGNADPQELLTSAVQDIRKYFIDKLIDLQPAGTQQILVRMADFEAIHPDLCKAALGENAPIDDLMRLKDESPLFMQAEGSEWMRFHPIARDALRERLLKLPHAVRSEVAKLAAAWYATHRLFQDAAQILRSVGELKSALEMAEVCLHEMLKQGQSAAVIEWVQGLSTDEMKGRSHFLLPAAWAFAMSERPADARPILEMILVNPNITQQDQFEVQLITSAIASYTDDFTLQANILCGWNDPPAFATQDLVPIFWTAKAFLALNLGRPDHARLMFGKVSHLDRRLSYTPSAYGFVDCGVAISHLWEGRYTLAEHALRPALARAEERMGRRSPITCMLAALLANACWELGRSDEARTLLALRFDVLERYGLPDVLISAHFTLAALASSEGQQDQALSLLESLSALGETRNMPRLRVTAMLELIKLHLKHGRLDTATKLSNELNHLVKAQPKPKQAAMPVLLEVCAELARAHVGLAQGGKSNLNAALQAAQAAISLADSIRRGTEGIQARILRSHGLRRLGYEDANAAMEEALSLASASGMVRLVAEVNETRSKPLPIDRPEPAAVTPLPTTDTASTQIAGTALLTIKERDVLQGLVRNLSNKEIALSMGISDQTIKWHIKNLFSKLNAASRKQAVARAQLLGLIVEI